MRPYQYMTLEERVLYAVALEVSTVRRYIRELEDYDPDRTHLPRSADVDALPPPHCWAIWLISDETIQLAKRYGWEAGVPDHPIYGPYPMYLPWMREGQSYLFVTDIPPIWERAERAREEEEQRLGAAPRAEKRVPRDIEEAEEMGWNVCRDTHTVTIISQRALSAFVMSGRWRCYLDEKSGLYIASPKAEE